ncbi:MAG: hypothetical protein KF861_00470 [Planctomycetaceae bacterium]|nr:hypothetical protein [Planctomycetaceae bacterium]
MTAIDLGAAQAVSWKLGEPGVTVILTVTTPDGSTVTPTVTEDAGTYTATVETTWPGRYLLGWAKDAAPAAAYTDILDVWPADPRFLISLAAARAAVGWGVNDTKNNDDLRLFTAAATPVIEDIVGAVLMRSIVQTSDGGKTGIALWERPASATDVTQVKVNGAVQDAGTYTVDPNAAIVYAGSSNAPTRFPFGRQNIEITYTTGSNQISPNVRLATAELVRHLWQVGRQGGRPGWGADESAEAQVYTPSGFAVPKRVIELCAPTPRLPGIG